MSNKVLLSPIMENPDYDSEDRRAALSQLGQIAELERALVDHELINA